MVLFKNTGGGRRIAAIETSNPPEESDRVKISVGSRLRSVTCPTEVIVVKAPETDIDLECGGAPMALAGDSNCSSVPLDPTRADGTRIGKRYVDPDLGIELLCTKGGAGTLTLAGTPLPAQAARHLPSSD